MANSLEVVLDTNVIVAALRSRNGASYRLVSEIGRSSEFEINLSVPVAIEYDSVLRRVEHAAYLNEQEIDDFLDYLCSVAHKREVFFLWRPILPDPKDDMVLELAVAAGCSHIVTFNRRDFIGAERFGLRVVTPGGFLQELGDRI